MLYLSSMRIIVLLYLVFMSTVGFSQARRALSLLDKNKKNEAYQLLTKAVAKDSLAPAVKYVLAKLFFIQDDARYNLDSAYRYILTAADDLTKSDDKTKTKLNSNGFNSESFGQLREEIERAGFIRAKQGGKEQDYIDFLEKFPSSLYVEPAIILRNIEAFGSAESINTFQSYQRFFEAYPEAKEVSEARNRYEKLLYEEKTADGKLLSYQEFLKEFTHTYYRHEVEQSIYNIITGRNSPAAYQEFIDLYPQSFLQEQALLMRYAQLNEAQQEEFLSSGAFSAQQIDSIYSLENLTNELILPIIHNGEFQLINTRNDVILGQINAISTVSKCELPIKNPILIRYQNNAELININGAVIAKDSIVSFEDESWILKINSFDNQYFVSVGGFRTNEHSFKEALIAGPYIAYKERSKWGLESITGISMIEAKYDSIIAFHEHIILSQEVKWGIFPVATFYPFLDGDNVELELPFDNISILDSGHLSLAKGKKSSVMDKNAQFIVPMAEQDVELVDDGYFIDQVDSLLDSRLSETWYYDINFNRDWTFGNRGDTTDVYYKGHFLLKSRNATTVGVSVAIVSFKDSTFCYFNDTTKILFGEGESIIPIRRMGENSTVRHFLHTDAKKKQRIYDGHGQRIIVPKFDKLVDIGDKYMLSQIKAYYYLLNSAGKVVLKEIDGATSLGNGYITFLKDKKFGLFNEDTGTLIEAKYDYPIKAYSDSLFIVENEHKYGILTRNDSMLIPAIYDEIRSLNDSILILKENFRWIFWDLKHGSPLLANVSDYWLYEVAGETVYKVFKGIGYGVWSPKSGIILSSTYDEIAIISKGDEAVYIAEKWVEEADIVIMLYYDKEGSLFRKEVLSTAEYRDLTCKTDQE
jgi:hypothetical protein